MLLTGFCFWFSVVSMADHPAILLLVLLVVVGVPGCLGACPALNCTMESVSCSCMGVNGSEYTSGLQGCGDVVFRDVEFEGFFIFSAL